MAVRFDAAADRLLITSSILNYNAANTMMAWVYLVSNLATNSTLWGWDNNSTSNIDHIRTTSGGLQLESRVSVAGTATQQSSGSLAVGQWAHVTSVRASATALDIYVNGVKGTTNTKNVSARTAATRFECGAVTSGNTSRGDIRLAFGKAWSVALDQNQILNEMWSAAPIYQTGLYGWWPWLPNTRTADWSGGNHVWADTGTTDEEGVGLPAYQVTFDIADVFSVLAGMRNPPQLTVVRM